MSTEARAELPIVCLPSALSSDERHRSSELRASIGKAVRQVHEVERGYAFELDDSAAILPELGAWIALERRCCPFLTFDVAWVAGEDRRPVLTLTGPEGTKAFLAAEMPELPSKPAR